MGSFHSVEIKDPHSTGFGCLQLDGRVFFPLDAQTGGEIGEMLL